MTEFHQPLQVQSHLEMPGDSGSARVTFNAPRKLAPQIDLKLSTYNRALDGTKLYVRYVHAMDVTYAKFHVRNERTAVP